MHHPAAPAQVSAHRAPQRSPTAIAFIRASMDGNVMARVMGHSKDVDCHNLWLVRRYGQHLNSLTNPARSAPCMQARSTAASKPEHDSKRMPSPSRRVLVVDDHALLRQGIRQTLTQNPIYEVVGEVGDGLDVYAECQRLEPDIIVLDLGLPGMNGIEVTRQLKRRWPDMIVIVLTAESSEFRAREALEVGASAYVLKRSAQQVLHDALAKATSGRIYIDPVLDEAQVTAPRDRRSAVTLTTRERQILQLVAQGARNKDIAATLHISVKTVETHRLNLMRKLDAHKAVELANWAHRLGLTVDTPFKPATGER